MASVEQKIRDKAQELGFVLCGFARADAAPHAGEELHEWLALGHHVAQLRIEARAGQRGAPAGL